MVWVWVERTCLDVSAGLVIKPRGRPVHSFMLASGEGCFQKKSERREGNDSAMMGGGAASIGGQCV